MMRPASEEAVAMEYGEAIIIDHLEGVEMGKSESEIYDRPIGLHRLYEHPDTGAQHFLIRYPGGLTGLRHRHTAAHTIVLLQGHLRVNDQVVGPGAYCHFPAGEPMLHAPAGDEDCLFVIMFDGPSDVEALIE
jgi:quercetin dioxygenase-like cupin family protein